MNYHRTTDGALVAEADALDATGVLKDGVSVRTRMNFMDAAPLLGAVHLGEDGLLHRPGFLKVADAILSASEAKRVERKARLSDAWKGAGPAAPVVVPADSSTPYERRDRRLERAWQDGGRA